MEDKTNIATLNVKSLPISPKMSVEICNVIRNKHLPKVRRMLQDVISMKRAIPVRRYGDNLGHKPGMGAGRYPINASKVFLKLIRSVEANAENKGLNVNNLFIVHAKADRGETRWRNSRMGRVKMKNTNVELKVEEKTIEEKKKKK